MIDAMIDAFERRLRLEIAESELGTWREELRSQYPFRSGVRCAEASRAKEHR